MDKNTLVQIVLVIAVIYLFFSRTKAEKEGMTNTAGVAQADLDAIKNLADIAKKLQEGGTTNPGNLNVSGTLTATNINNKGNDFQLGFGNNERGDTGNSRALVKLPDRGLAINFGSDFAGGTYVQSNLNVVGTTSFGNNVGLSNKQLRLRDIGDAAHYMAYATDVDGVEIKGYAGGKLTTHDGTATPFKWTKTGVEVNGNLTATKFFATGNLVPIVMKTYAAKCQTAWDTGFNIADYPVYALSRIRIPGADINEAGQGVFEVNVYPLNGNWAFWVDPRLHPNYQSADVSITLTFFHKSIAVQI